MIAFCSEGLMLRIVKPSTRQNGAQIATHLKKDKLTKDIPVIIISANHNMDKILERVPVDDFIPKPFELSTLMEKVNTYLRRRD